MKSFQTELLFWVMIILLSGLNSAIVRLFYHQLMVQFCYNYKHHPLGTFIHDLFGGQPAMESLITQWTIHGKTDLGLSGVYPCSTWFNLGQPGLLGISGYFERSYVMLPPHKFVIYEISMFIMDSWTNSDYYEILIDGTPFSRGYPNGKRIPSGNHLCGDAAEIDYFDMTYGRVSHTNTALTIKIVPHLSGSPAGGWLAFRDLIILFSNQTSIVQDKCSNGNPGTDECKCIFGSYFDPNDPNQCLQCHANCHSCYGPSDSECYYCKAPCSFDGMRCRDPQVYGCYYYDFITNKCSFCYSHLILHWNGACVTQCDVQDVFVNIGGFGHCKTPCQANNSFMLWNNTCSDKCDLPLVKRTHGYALFCDYPCDPTTNQYLYSNGSCLTSCDFFLKTEGGRSFCDSCPENGFLYPNGSCLAACPSPRISKGTGGYNYCVSPCNDHEFYTKKDGKCITCKYPNKVEDNIFCVLDLSEETTKVLGTISTVSQSASHVKNVTVTLIKMAGFANPSAALFGSLGDLMMFIKYLKINYPPKLQYMLDEPQSQGVLQAFMSIPGVIEDCFVKRALPENFKKYEIPSSFFVNFWQNYFNLAMIMSIIISLWILKFCLKKYVSIDRALTAMKQALKWNFIIASCIGYFGDIAFYSYMEMKTVVLDSFWSVLSFLTCIATNILAFALILQILKINIDIVSAKSHSSGLIKRVELVKNKWKEYEVAFENFKEDSLPKQAYLSIFMIRLYIFNIFVTCFFEHPLVQIIFVTVISSAMIGYLVISRPFKQKKNLIESLVQEIALMVVNICVLILASLDQAKREAVDTREILGNIILGVNTGFSVVGSLYQNLQLILTIKSLITKFMKKRYEKKAIEANKVIKFDNQASKKKELFKDLPLNMHNPERAHNFSNSSDLKPRKKIWRPPRVEVIKPSYQDNFVENQTINSIQNPAA